MFFFVNFSTNPDLQRSQIDISILFATHVKGLGFFLGGAKCFKAFHTPPMVNMAHKHDAVEDEFPFQRDDFQVNHVKLWGKESSLQTKTTNKYIYIECVPQAHEGLAWNPRIQTCFMSSWWGLVFGEALKQNLNWSHSPKTRGSLTFHESYRLFKKKDPYFMGVGGSLFFMVQEK